MKIIKLLSLTSLCLAGTLHSSTFEKSIASKNDRSSQLIEYLKQIKDPQDIASLTKNINSILGARGSILNISSENMKEAKSFHYDAGAFYSQLRIYFVSGNVSNNESSALKIVGCEVYLQEDTTNYVEYSFVEQKPTLAVGAK